MPEFFVSTEPPLASAAPGGCYLCKVDQRVARDGTREPLVDTHIDIEYEGKLLICETCVMEMAAALGALNPTEAERLRGELESVQLDLRDQADALSGCQETNRALLQDTADAFGASRLPQPEPEKPEQAKDDEAPAKQASAKK